MRKIDLSNFQVARSETARHINRRIVLNLIRSHEPISRADLARHSGLQRSTVSVITEQLIRERWVKEGGSGRAARGRRPRFLHLNKERVGIIGINIRPRETVIGLADLDARFTAQESIATGSDPERFVADLAARIRALTAARPEISYEGIGVSLPGRVDLATQRLVFAPNLGWSDFDLREPLERLTGLPVELENAANACALAEIWFGRHGSGNLIALTVSEGIGSGLILNHQLVRGSQGLSGEFGHMTIVEDWEGAIECRCGNRGCWEVYASNSAALRYYLQSASTSRGNSRRRRERSRQETAQALDFDDLLRLAEQGDARAVAAIERMGRYLGCGIAMLITGLAPDLIVVVGEVTRLWERVGRVVERTIEERCTTRPATRVEAADPAAHPRLLGTIALVMQRHFGAPTVA